MTHHNRRLDIALAIGLAAFVLLPWYRVEGGFYGFDEIYGDYGEVAVTNTGKTIVTWGEGFSYTGPGGTWFNIQR